MRAREDGNTRFNRRVPLARTARKPTKRYAMIDQHIIADLCRLTDHHAHAVVDEQPPSKLRAGVDFDPGQKTAEMRNQPPCPAPAALPEPMRKPVPQNGMQPGITENRLWPGRPRGIARADAAAYIKRFPDHRVVLMQAKAEWAGRVRAGIPG